MITKEFAAIVLEEFEKDSHFKRAIQSASLLTGIKLKCNWEDLWVSSGTIGSVRTLGVAQKIPRASGKPWATCEELAGFTFTGDQEEDVQWLRFFLERFELWEESGRKQIDLV